MVTTDDAQLAQCTHRSNIFSNAQLPLELAVTAGGAAEERGHWRSAGTICVDERRYGAARVEADDTLSIRAMNDSFDWSGFNQSLYGLCFLSCLWTMQMSGYNEGTLLWKLQLLKGLDTPFAFINI